MLFLNMVCLTVAFATSDMEALSAEIQQERMDYVEKSRHLTEQLHQLRNEIETLKVEEKTTNFDRLHLENLQRGENKYHTLQKIRTGTTGSRVAFFEGL
jgi:merlin protein